MQLALFSQTPFSQDQAQATRVLPGRTAELEAQASNDDSFHEKSFHEEGSPWRMVLCVLANVIGGAILLSGMFILPHVIARMLS